MSDSSAAPAGMTYQGALSALQALSERSKKHRSKNPAAGANRAMDGVLSDAEQLLYSLKRHTMHSDSPSSRITEAQVWMHKAVIEKTAGRFEDEADSYLTAASIWLAMEVERKTVNMMTSGDALARAVLCCAMACNVLLTLKPNIATSPLPIKLTKMLNPHISRCWAICVRLAHRLAEFSCYEMSADYFEMAAILVTIDEPPGSCAAATATGATMSSSPPPDASHSKQATNSSFATLSSCAQLGTGSPHRAAAVGGSRRVSASHVDPAASEAAYHIPPSVLLATSSAAPSQQGSPTQSVRSRMTATTHQYHHLSSTYRADRTFNRAVYGERSLKRGHAPGVLILNGFVNQYVVALSSCCMTAALIQDYARCLTATDELLAHLQSIEVSRRPAQLVPSWAQRHHYQGDDDKLEEQLLQPHEMESGGGAVLEEEHMGGNAANDASAVLPRELLFHHAGGDTVSCNEDVSNDSGPCVAASTCDTTLDAMPAASRDQETSEQPGTENTSALAETEQKADVTSTPTLGAVRGGAPSSVSSATGGHEETSSSVVPLSSSQLNPPHRSAARGEAPSTATGSAGAAGGSADASGCGVACPIAPPPGGSLHAHGPYKPLEHFFFLVETEKTRIQMHLLKFFVLLILRDPQLTFAGAQEEISFVCELAALYRKHERFTRCIRNGDSTTISVVPSSAQPAYSSLLYRLTAVLEALAETIESYPSENVANHTTTSSGDSDVHKFQEGLVRQLFEEVRVLCQLLGCTSRNLLIIIERAERCYI